jgi:O-antigen ligase
MIRVKGNRKKSAVAEAMPPPPSWPEDFAPPRTALLMAVCSAALGAMVFLAAVFGALGPVKTALASMLGMYNPAMVSDSGFDLAVMVWGMGTILLGGIIHPSVGIAVLVLFRPWIDGYTFPTDNLCFVCGVFVLTALWAVRIVLRGGRIGGLGFAAPLALWLLVAAVGLRSAWEFDVTCRQVLLWFSYLMLFVLAVNSVTSRLALGFILGGTCVTMGLEGLFAVLHYEFLLPFLREIVHKPGILQQYFGTDTITPELARRFSINRAFGSVLFPNSLAAYLMLGAPVIAAGTWLAWRRLRETADAENSPAAPRAASLAALGVWLISTALIMFACHFPAIYRDDTAGTPWYFQIGSIFAFSALLSLAPAAWVYFLSLRRGLLQCSRALAAGGLTAALALVVLSLILTYSRGGWLALAAASVWAGVLLRGGPSIGARLRRLFPALVAAVLVAGMAWGWSRAVTTGSAWAQETKSGTAASSTASGNGPRSTTVTQEGTAVSAKDLLDPASFRVRLTYWRVALSMARHNMLTGVGLGNFAIAYAHYQYLGAGDVREAHSGYLQSFCETGIPGGVLFVLFWAALLAGGALNVLRAPDTRTRLWLLGLHTGLLAFCLHAAIDINFSHPSLVMTAMVVAGLGLGWRGPEPADSGSATPRTTGHRLLAGVMLVLIALAGGVVARIWVQELTLSRLTFSSTSNDREIFRRFRAAKFFLDDVYKFALAKDSGKQTRNVPQLSFREALNLNPDPDRWAKTADFFVADKSSPQGYRRLNPGEPIPLDAVMMIRRPHLAKWTATDGISGWLVEMEAIDSWFPRSPALAMHIARLYELLVKNPMPETNARQRLWTTGYYDWARTALERSPHSAEMHEFYANVMAYRALHDSPYTSLPNMESAVAHAETAVEYSPIAPSYQFFLNWALEQLASLQRQAGDTAKADALAQRAVEVKQKAQDLQNRRWNLGLPY